MKRKIGEIYNKKIVEGDKNLVDKDYEIHKDDLSGGEGDGSNVQLEHLLYYFDGTTDNSKLTINLTRKTAEGYMGIDAVSSGFVEFINDTDIILHVPGLSKLNEPEINAGVIYSATLEVEYDDGSHSSEETHVLKNVLLYSYTMTSQSANKFDLSIGGKKYHIETVGYSYD